jgi:hypothetical protein
MPQQATPSPQTRWATRYPGSGSIRSPPFLFLAASEEKHDPQSRRDEIFGEESMIPAIDRVA